MSELLNKAREYEIEQEKQIAEQERPGFHLTPRTGWSNDPNGFSFYDGNYHLFYQYHPYSAQWGPMHWGHAVSKDLIHWEYLPAAMAPDEKYDQNGCFSGSAMTLPDGRHLLMYTGVENKKNSRGEMQEFQTQCIAIGDGMEYEKYESNPVIDETMLPKDASVSDCRDPKIWRDDDGTYYCVVGNHTEEPDGQLLLFQSEDALHWSFSGVAAKSNGKYGTMWECPDFFALEDKQVLICSPIGMEAESEEYPFSNEVMYMLGSFDKETKKFCHESDRVLDCGLDFYAPQTMLAPDGRRLLIAWMQNSRTGGAHSDQKKWYGQMTTPRELSIKDGKLIQKPVREIEDSRKKKIRHKNLVFSGELAIGDLAGNMFDMEVSIRPVTQNDKNFEEFSISFAQNPTKREECMTLVYSPKESRLTLRRDFSDAREEVLQERSCLLEKDLKECQKGCLKVRLLLDRYSAELFINDGERVMTALIDTEMSGEDICFFTDAPVRMDIVKYDL